MEGNITEEESGEIEKNECGEERHMYSEKWVPCILVEVKGRPKWNTLWVALQMWVAVSWGVLF